VNHIDTIVIGAGHSGLAVSHLLTRAGREHVVLDRGRVGERWRTERWDSLRLLSPRWLSRLPGWSYSGPDVEGFMPAAEFVRHLERYARTSDAPLSLGEEVQEVAAARGGYRVATSSSWWLARHVVIATGATGRPVRPAGIDRLDDKVFVLGSAQYRNPSQLPPGGVLVVGASASGVQIADELARAGRRVVLAVGRHNRMPRRYRDRDIFWWLERTGRLARTRDSASLGPAPQEPSLQLAGRAEGDPRGLDVDLGSLQRAGVELAGRLVGVGRRHVEFADDLASTVGKADGELERLLDMFDARAEGLGHAAHPARRPQRVQLPGRAPRRLDLSTGGIGTVLLATGFHPHHPWLRVPVAEADGTIRQVRGATPAPGLFVIGQRWQHRRDSTFIDGARHAARDVVRQMCLADGVPLLQLEAS
jgi:putative flavoprotein involved in K+ transport